MQLVSIYDPDRIRSSFSLRDPSYQMEGGLIAGSVRGLAKYARPVSATVQNCASAPRQAHPASHRCAGRARHR